MIGIAATASRGINKHSLEEKEQSQAYYLRWGSNTKDGRKSWKATRIDIYNKPRRLY